MFTHFAFPLVVDMWEEPVMFDVEFRSILVVMVQHGLNATGQSQ
jgi:hypothetical protein